MDWCQFNAITQTDVWKYIRVIPITNSEAPGYSRGLRGCRGLQLRCRLCGRGYLLLSKRKTIAPSRENLGYEYGIKPVRRRKPDRRIREGAEIDQQFPLGTHQEHLHAVEDDCGNVSTCSRNLHHRGQQNPTPVCRRPDCGNC
ncbi:MAG: hypothetical protein IPJ00_19075 [Saprospirales bacterium]|nr:hypothetical protein [Saprospirales bacterium]